MKLILEKPLNIKKVEEKHLAKWDYNKIMENPIPKRFMNSFLDKTAWRWQGDRGTCCGQSMARVLDLIHYDLTKQEPTGNIIRGADYDTYFDISYSAEYIYRKSRTIANLTDADGDGSYIWSTIKAAQINGCCLDRQWKTSKTPENVFVEPYPDKLKECEQEAMKHTIDGYASARDLKAVKRGIFEHGAVIGAIDIYSNCMSSPKVDGLYDGNFPEPNGEVDGSHALCWVGFNDIEGRLYCVHSWEGFTELGSISYAYFNYSGNDFWIPLDKNEVLIGEAVYNA